MAITLVTCNCCKNQFFPYPRERKDSFQGEPVDVLYIECPFCKERYTILVKDAEINQLIDQRKRLLQDHSDMEFEEFKKKDKRLKAAIDSLCKELIQDYEAVKDNPYGES